MSVAIRAANSNTIYRGRQPWELPLYSTYEAAHYVGLPVSTAYAWLEGEAKLVRLKRESSLLNFKNLVELYVLNTLRRHHRIPLAQVRRAVTYLKEKMNLEYPLADCPLDTYGTSVFMERVGSLINLSEAGQLEFQQLIAPYLKRVERGPHNEPLRVFPITSKNATAHFVSIDPAVQFGRPCIAGTRIKTEILLERRKAGDSIAALAKDYGLTPRQITEAISYEQGAA